MFYEIITNKILVIPMCSWAMTQLLKVVIILIRKKRLDLRYLVISGGMPSSHSAIVSSLATVLAVVEGVGSVLFGISAIFALIVMYDAAGVRRSVGQQSEVLNRILQDLRVRRPMTEWGRDLREFIGHTSYQVIVGSLLGIVIAWSWLNTTGY
ncbi:divergent PAP2 family protein [Chloroflexota bacterium]